MELLRTEDVSSVVLFDLRLSEGELQYLALAVRYVLENLSAGEIHSALNDERGKGLQSESETKEFLEREYIQLMNLIKWYCRPEYLPSQFRNWEPRIDDSIKSDGVE